MRYWLFKSEPDCFSIQDLAKSPKKTTAWTGVRNYQARNFIRDDMRKGDRVLFHHSSANPPAIAGVAKIVREHFPDVTAFDETDDHYDPKSKRDDPTWFAVNIQLEEIFKEPIPLERLRSVPALKNMELLKRGSRLSIQPVTKPEFDAVLRLAGK